MQNFDRAVLIGQLQKLYANFAAADFAELHDIYIADIAFSDPVLTLQGMPELSRYFAHGMANADACTFTFLNTVITPERAFLEWEMCLQHAKLNGGKQIILPGCSHLTFAVDENKIAKHVDYYDLGAMVYEHVPLIGALIRIVQKRLAAF